MFKMGDRVRYFGSNKDIKGIKTITAVCGDGCCIMIKGNHNVFTPTKFKLIEEANKFIAYNARNKPRLRGNNP